jgi:hypothetical protein
MENVVSLLYSLIISFDFILLHGSFSFSHHLSSFVLSGANNSVRRKSIPSLNNINTNDKTNVNETMVLTATVNNRTMEMRQIEKTKQNKTNLISILKLHDSVIQVIDIDSANKKRCLC